MTRGEHEEEEEEEEEGEEDEEEEEKHETKPGNTTPGEVEQEKEEEISEEETSTQLVKTKKNSVSLSLEDLQQLVLQQEEQIQKLTMRVEQSQRKVAPKGTRAWMADKRVSGLTTDNSVNLAGYGFSGVGTEEQARWRYHQLKMSIVFIFLSTGKKRCCS